MRVAIFGDTGGQYKQLRAGLETVGLTENNMLPEDLTIIHVGDLIHKGPNSNEVVSMVSDIMSKNPDRWIQLMGNHEGQYVGGPEFWAGENISPLTIQTIRLWYASAKANIAVGVIDRTNNNEPILVTHAGLAPRFLKTFAKNTEDLAEIVEYINDWPIALQFSPGYMLGGEATGNGGPTWAHCVYEVYTPWFNLGSMPFSQAHGHTTPYWWDAGKWARAIPEPIAMATTLDVAKRHSVTQLGSHRFISTDPGYAGKTIQQVQFPFVIEDAELVL